MFRDYTYIVTGCTGHVGNVLTKKLLAEGCRVVGFARSPKKAAVVFQDKAPEFVYGDITDPNDIERLFVGEGPFAVIHTAAKVSIGEDARSELEKVTVQGTQNLVDACLHHPVKKFLHISSTEAIPHGITLREDLSNYVPEPSKAITDYAGTKSEADAIVLRAVQEHGLDASLLLLASVLGPGDYSNGHMTQMMIEFMEGRLPASVNGGYNDFDIRDVADVLPAIVEKSKKAKAICLPITPTRSTTSFPSYLPLQRGNCRPPFPCGSPMSGFRFCISATRYRKSAPCIRAPRSLRCAPIRTSPSAKRKKSSAIPLARWKRRSETTSNSSSKITWCNYENFMYLLHRHL